jgi:hypothetical protein
MLVLVLAEVQSKGATVLIRFPVIAKEAYK